MGTWRVRERTMNGRAIASCIAIIEKFPKTRCQAEAKLRPDTLFSGEISMIAAEVAIGLRSTDERGRAGPRGYNDF